MIAPIPGRGCGCVRCRQPVPDPPFRAEGRIDYRAARIEYRRVNPHRTRKDVANDA